MKISSYETGNRGVGVSWDDDYVVMQHGNANLPGLRFNEAEWDAFVQGVKMGEFDLPIEP